MACVEWIILDFSFLFSCVLLYQSLPLHQHQRRSRNLHRRHSFLQMQTLFALSFATLWESGSWAIETKNQATVVMTVESPTWNMGECSCRKKKQNSPQICIERVLRCGWHWMCFCNQRSLTFATCWCRLIFETQKKTQFGMIKRQTIGSGTRRRFGQCSGGGV